MPLVSTRGAASAQGFGEFAQQTAVNYIEDVFSCFLYTGNGSTQTITNGIDLSTKGGLVWIKDRTTAGQQHNLIDTVRGPTNRLSSNYTGANSNDGGAPSFNSNGFTVVANSSGYTNSGDNFVSWTFREQPKFFDIVTYTGTGANRTIAHNLGSVPGCIMVKRTDTAADWAVYHRSLANTQYLVLNSTAAAATGATRWNSTTPTSTVFSIGTDATVNASAGTYVAYLFAHDAGGFGLAGTDNVISCGSYTGNGSATGPVVTLGYEPQWLMVKASSITGNWFLFDNMRGMTVGGVDANLKPNSTAVEANESYVDPTATGFNLTSASSAVNSSAETYIYIAIRRGPMKVPTVGTSVFALGGTSSSTLTTSFAVDAFIQNSLTSSAANSRFCSRLQGSDRRLVTSSTDAEAADNGDSQFGGASYTVVGAGGGIVFGFGRAPGFFDEVCWTGTGSYAVQNHNLGVAPELVIQKARTTISGGNDWYVNTATQYGYLNQTTAFTSFARSLTSSTFQPVADGSVNWTTYLFATLAGVSKVGTYTGTAATLQINCGFTAGARFVLIKRTDSTGDWYVWDSARGIVAGNDPYLLLNSTAAQVTSTDYVDTYSAGFEISSTAPAAINASAGSFIFLAIA